MCYVESTNSNPSRKTEKVRDEFMNKIIITMINVCRRAVELPVNELYHLFIIPFI